MVQTSSGPGKLDVVTPSWLFPGPTKVCGGFMNLNSLPLWRGLGGCTGGGLWRHNEGSGYRTPNPLNRGK